MPECKCISKEGGGYFYEKDIIAFAKEKGLNYTINCPYLDDFTLELNYPYNSYISDKKASLKFQKNDHIDHKSDSKYRLAGSVYTGDRADWPAEFMNKSDEITIDTKKVVELNEYVDYLVNRLKKREKIRRKAYERFLANEKKIKIQSMGIIGELNALFEPYEISVARNKITHRIEASYNYSDTTAANDLSGQNGYMLFDVQEADFADRYHSHVKMSNGYWVRFSLPNASSYSYAFAKNDEGVIELANFWLSMRLHGKNSLNDKNSNYIFTRNDYMKVKK